MNSEKESIQMRTIIQIRKGGEDSTPSYGFSFAFKARTVIPVQGEAGGFLYPP